MTSSDIGTWIGTAFSIIGAGIAIWQARQARSAAHRAEEVRDEIETKHQHGELSGLDSALAAAIRAMDKYGPGVGQTNRRGVSPEADAAAVRAFTADMNRHREMLNSTFGNSCDDVRDRINGWLAEFGDTADAAVRLERGRSIYLEITTFSGNMKQALDKKVFGKHAAQPRVRQL